MKNKFSRKYFQLTVCFNGFDQKMVWSENFHFKPFPDSRAMRERERSHPDHATNPLTSPFFELNKIQLRLRLQIAPFDFAREPRAQITPRTQSLDHAFDFAEIAPQDRTNHTEIAPITPRRHQSHRDHTNLSLSRSSAAVLRWYWSISHSLFLLLSIRPNLMNFFGWVLFLCLSIEKWYYIFVWKLRKCEEQEKKCVFYIIFSNTTKH